ncbi:hypothetical protein [Janibacter sp. GS2]|uniref:hypothetical protein n=1 Tax=Janibacter sp. GS2 TaxID=3442646 RepID=UPI003EC024E6
MRSARVVGVLAALALAGCSALPGGDEPTSPPATSSGSESTTDEGPVTGAGRPLDEAELHRVLPSPADLGPDWAHDPAKTIFETETSDISPSACAPLLLKGPERDKVLSSQRARVQDNYVRGESTVGHGSFMGIWAYSTDEAMPSRLFDDAGSLIGTCSSMEVTQADTGSVSTYRSSQLPFPNMGDRTLALRTKISQSLRTVTMDYVVIKVGHNTVFVVNGDYLEEPDTSATERAARAALKNLREST